MNPYDTTSDPQAQAWSDLRDLFPFVVSDVGDLRSAIQREDAEAAIRTLEGMTKLLGQASTYAGILKHQPFPHFTPGEEAMRQHGIPVARPDDHIGQVP